MNGVECRVTPAETAEIAARIPGEREIHRLAELFRVLGDPTRVRILSVLQHQPLCVNDLAEVLGMQQTAVSHQLKVLRHNRLVRNDRLGRMVVYSLDDEHVAALFTTGLEHTREYLQ